MPLLVKDEEIESVVVGVSDAAIREDGYLYCVLQAVKKVVKKMEVFLSLHGWHMMQYARHG